MKKIVFVLTLIMVVIYFISPTLYANPEQTKYYFSRSIHSKGYAELPQVLNEHDLKTYYDIYIAQNKNDFKKADDLIETLHDDLLVGYLYYLRYISKNYNPTFTELKNWLNKYNKLAVAMVVYKQAQKKAPNTASKKQLVSPNNFYDRFIPLHLRHELFSEPTSTIQPTSIPKPKLVKNQTATRLTAAIKGGKTLNIKNILLNANTKKSLGSYTYDYYISILTKLYFLDGMDDQAIYWGKKIDKKNRNLIPEASFTIGLAYFRKQDYDNARVYFGSLANKNSNLHPEIIVKGAYWTARTSLLLSDIDNYFEYLNQASSYIYSFYGILAREELGITPQYTWNNINHDKQSFNLLLDSEYGRRALALLQLGLLDWSEQELIFFTNYHSSKLSKKEETNALNIIMYMAHNIPMPALSLKLAGQNGKYYGLSHLTYPVFLVDLEDGYKVDPSLLLAVMKKESLFFSSAQSSPGATGLMQVLPSTASYLINKYNLPTRTSTLANTLTAPVYNIELGQNYINLLLDNPNAENNLIYVLAGYNAGFSLLQKWKKESHRKSDDPLFFIESIPYAETRDYIKIILSDYWIYQLKLGIPPHSLMSIVQGGQPIYYSLPQDDIEKLKNFKYSTN